MPTEVIMPKVDMDMASGRLAVWHVAEGELVAKGAPLFDIETDKAAMEVEAPATGRLHHLAAVPGQQVAVGAPVAWIYAEGEAVGAAPLAPAPLTPATPASAARPPLRAGEGAAPGPSSAPPAGTGAAPPYPVAAAGVAAAGVLRATPAARAIARSAGLALEGLAGSGPQGRIQRADVEGALRPAATSDWQPQPGPLSVTRRKGEGRPLLLIHGFAADSAGWMPLERALPQGRPLIRIDLASHGRSPRRHVTGFAALARMVTEAFDEATADLGPVHLLGHSLGGALALALADTRPRRIASLCLIAPAGLGPQIDGAALTGIARASRAESLGPWLRRLTARPDALGDDFIRAAFAPRRDPALRAAQLALADVLFPDGTQGFDLRAALDRLDLPAAMIWGRDDHILPWRQALAAPGEMALHLLPGTGHIPHVECPQIVAAILSRLMGGAETTR